MAATETPEANASVRDIYRGPDFRAHYFVCSCGPDDPVFEEAHDESCVAAVLSGFFHYRTDCDVASLTPGSLLLGNKGQPYQCSHEHSHGDLSLVFHFSHSMIDSILKTCAGAGASSEFRNASLPPTPERSTAIGRAQAAAAASDVLWLEEVAYGLAACALSQDRPDVWHVRNPASVDIRRVADALEFIEANFSMPLTLTELADVAGVSTFHFLRTFRAVTGATPYHYVVQMRLREAAARLAGSDELVTNIAFDVGFGDLSQFVRTFKNASGLSPNAFRRASPKEAVTVI